MRVTWYHKLTQDQNKKGAVPSWNALQVDDMFPNIYRPVCLWKEVQPLVGHKHYPPPSSKTPLILSPHTSLPCHNFLLLLTTHILSLSCMRPNTKISQLAFCSVLPYPSQRKPWCSGIDTRQAVGCSQWWRSCQCEGHRAMGPGERIQGESRWRTAR